MRVVALLTDDKRRTRPTRAEQPRQRTQHDHVKIEINATMLDEQLQPEHVAAMSGSSQRSSKDRRGKLDPVQLHQWTRVLPPSAVRLMMIMEEQPTLSVMLVRCSDGQVVHERERVGVVSEAEDEVEWDC